MRRNLLDSQQNNILNKNNGNNGNSNSTIDTYFVNSTNDKSDLNSNFTIKKTDNFTTADETNSTENNNEILITNNDNIIQNNQDENFLRCMRRPKCYGQNDNDNISIDFAQLDDTINYNNNNNNNNNTNSYQQNASNDQSIETTTTCNNNPSDSFKFDQNDSFLNKNSDIGKLESKFDLLSPNEGPLARRYAEIAQSKFETSKNGSSPTIFSNILPVEDQIWMSIGSPNCEQTTPPIINQQNSISTELLSGSERISNDSSSSDKGILAEGETSSETSEGQGPSYNLSLIERLTHTHPVWFLPFIQRAGAVHLLQGKDEGNFIVRSSSQPNTMAVSVRLPPNTGPYIEHYLIQSQYGQLNLESSHFTFDSIPALIAHYAQCCDELPVQLTLPTALCEATNRQQLLSLALLGQEFWRYSMISPKRTQSTTSPSSTHLLKTESSSGIGSTIISCCVANNNNNHHQFSKHNSSSSPTHFESFILIPPRIQHDTIEIHENSIDKINLTNKSTKSSLSGTNTITANQIHGDVFSQGGTPSDTSSLSSFFSTNSPHSKQLNHHQQQLQQKLLSPPESVDSMFVTTPISTDSYRSNDNVAFASGGGSGGSGTGSTIGKTSTFKSQNDKSMSSQSSSTNFAQFINQDCGLMYDDEFDTFRVGRTNRRPTPPNTLNLNLIKSPPAPPPRLPKLRSFPITSPPSMLPPPPPASIQGSAAGPSVAAAVATPSSPLDGQKSNQFSVTTTVTFSVDGCQSPHIVEVTSPSSLNPPSNGQFQTISKRLSPEGGESKDAPTDTMSSQGSRRWHHHQSRSRRIKNSKHYQESDILESPQIYCGGASIDKSSDYEDLWSQQENLNSPLIICDTQIPYSRWDDNNKDIKSSLSSFSSKNQRPSQSSSFSDTDNQSLNESFIRKKDTSHKNDIPNRSELALHIPEMMITAPSATSTPVNLLSSIAVLQPLIPASPSPPPPSAPLALASNSTITTPIGVLPSGTTKQGSPLYSEPADTLLLSTAIRRCSTRNDLLSHHRHSEPGGQIKNVTEILSQKFNEHAKSPVSGSLDELQKRNLYQPNQQQQHHKHQHHHQHQQQQSIRRRHEAWTLGSSWEFMNNNDDVDVNGSVDNIHENENDLDWQENDEFASNKNDLINFVGGNNRNNKIIPPPITIHQIIHKKLPELNLPKLIENSTSTMMNFLEVPSASSSSTPIELTLRDSSNRNCLSLVKKRISSYDNVEKSHSGSTYGHGSSHSDDGTIFSEPWDNSQWDSFPPNDDSLDTIHMSKQRSAAIGTSEDDTIIEEESFSTPTNTLRRNQTKYSGGTGGKGHSQKLATILRPRNMRDREVLCHPRNKSTENTSTGGPGDTIETYALSLGQDPTSTFAQTIKNFISCTKESRELSPQIVMRNMRQFMSGMKNYLVKHGEGDFQNKVLGARSQLKADEFLNLDQILEGVMHQLVVLPLREHLYGLFVEYYTGTGDIQMLVKNVKYASGRSATEFGIRATILPPAMASMKQISKLLIRLQEAELPLDKLEYLLAVVSAIYKTTSISRDHVLSADDFLPLFVYIVAKCGFIGAEIEAEYMWCLLQKSLLSGEAGYYLTALCSAVHVLKGFMATSKLDSSSSSSSLDNRSLNQSCSPVLRVIIPDEYNGSLQTRTLPIRPNTITRDVCRTIAHKARITNPQDYGLFKLVDGEETLLSDSDCPQEVRQAANGKTCMLAYKRLDAKIAWPTHQQSSTG